MRRESLAEVAALPRLGPHSATLGVEIAYRRDPHLRQDELSRT
jgi:hypothetical protein